jgi:hypothetical protein
VLPVVTSDIRKTLEEIVVNNSDEWKREMVHHLKEDNPELNSLLLGLAQDSSDAKKIILAGYLVYKALEIAEEQEGIGLD